MTIFRSVFFVILAAVSSVLITELFPTLSVVEASEGSSRVRICDARQFRHAVTTVCAFKRRDIPSSKMMDRFHYDLNGTKYLSDIREQLDRYSKHKQQRAVTVGMTTTNTGINHSVNKVKRRREIYLHRICCMNGCTAMDFSGVC